MAPTWHALLAPLPDNVVVHRKPVASAAQLAGGQAGSIAGWDSISVNLSDPPRGLRHVLVVVDEAGTLLSANDAVLFHREEQRGGDTWNIYDHENVGGRFEADGSFNGTRWRSRTEHLGDDDEPKSRSATPSTPTPEDVTRLRAVVAWVLARAPKQRS
jgi:hypothetical protein